MRRLFKSSFLPLASKIIIKILLDKKPEDKPQCVTTLDEMMSDFNMSRKTLEATLYRMVKSGIISVHKPWGSKNLILTLLQED